VQAVALFKKTKKKNIHIKGTAKSRIFGAETLKPIATKFACRVPFMILKEGSKFDLFH